MVYITVMSSDSIVSAAVVMIMEIISERIYKKLPSQQIQLRIQVKHNLRLLISVFTEHNLENYGNEFAKLCVDNETTKDACRQVLQIYRDEVENE